MSYLPNHRSPGRRNNLSGYEESGSGNDDAKQTSTGENVTNTENSCQRGYTMFTPQEARRRKMLEGARKEEEQYQKRQDAKRSQPIRETPRSLGGGASHSDVLLKKQREVTVSSLNNSLKIRQKREKYVRQKKEEENKIHEERKTKARAQAERNERRAAERQLALHEDHRRKNLDFLDRLEYPSSPGSAVSASSRREERLRSRNRLDKGKHQVRSPESSPRQGDLQYLSSLFPDYDEEILATILEDAGGSVEQAKKLLS